MTLVIATIGAGCSAQSSTDAPADETLASATVNDGHAPVSPFVPPTPAGCAGATAYDLCFAFDKATPLAVNITLPESAASHAVGVVRFHRVSGAADAPVAEHVEFTFGEKRDLRLYFQVYPGAYRISVGIDADGDGNPDGPRDAIGWSSSTPGQAVVDEASAAVVDVGSDPIETSFALAVHP
jgi:hypothetical protein